MSRDVAPMQWMDCETYFGPDRRSRSRLRLINRRRSNAAGQAPGLRTALRRFRMRLIDGYTHPSDLVQHARGLAVLAELQRETLVASALERFCAIAEREAADQDVTLAALYHALDCAETALGVHKI